MSGNAARAILLAGLALALAACSSDSEKAAQVNVNVYPTNYKSAVIATLRALFEKNETVSVSDALISPPVLSQVGNSQLYTLCVRYIAHGAGPGLVGTATRRAYFYSGQLNQLVPAKDEDCAGVAYQPFNELNKLCIGQACENRANKQKGRWSLF